METKIYNKNNLKKEEINEFIYRSRGLIINSHNEVLLGYSMGTYQFPGGYVEDGETKEEGLRREIMEETGIKLKDTNFEPFYQVVYYNKNWPREGINRYTEFNYYVINTDERYNLSMTNYDDCEEEKNFELRYISLNDIEDELDKTMNNNTKNELVYKDMKEVIAIYRKMFATKI